MTRRAGDVVEYDFQADVFRGRFRLVERVGRNRWLVEDLEPDEAETNRILDYYTSADAYLGYHDPFGPERRQATPDEAFEREIAERRERAGRRHEIEFISAARYAEYF